jgi:sodium transport system permease protein
MRRSVVRLIAVREARDQLRDRRTMFLILGLPLLMYPLFIGIGILFATTLKEKKLVIGVVGAEHLPQHGFDPSPLIGVPAGVHATRKSFPPLLTKDNRFIESGKSEVEAAQGGTLEYKSVAEDQSLLTSRQIDALVIVEPGLAAKLERGERPVIRVLGRDGEENSKLAVNRITDVLRKWSGEVKAVRFARRELPPDFDSPVEIRDPQSEKDGNKRIADEFRDVLVKAIPLLLVMWVLTGAIHPAIDMTAGEKERGTMETLLISPAARTEIVAGKFLAVTFLSFGTAVWNIALMVGAVAGAQAAMKADLLSLPGLAACVLASLPMAMLFAAGCLALGVFARSTKEGNYYMVPIFFVVLPLAYWSMAPGMELDAKTSWVPVTNALLLQQRLMSVRPDPFPWQHVPAVVGSLVLLISLGLWGAIRQFNREAVLFREAEQRGRKWSLFGRRA